ncbi:GNAT family N-acetyltransferase [Streptomyces roseirectus]|uniref:GNAT family N-acetyltransferase n=1 Tax=Streptomyces roseirectus TaxID=2768066 RepID=UPI0031B6073F
MGGESDAPALVEAGRDPVLRHWGGLDIGDEGDALRWIGEQRRGWARGERLAFAVVEAGGRVLGHAVLKRPGAAVAEVGYWTAAAARGRGVASEMLRGLTEWAFGEYPALERVELIHQVDNVASCRVAEKGGYGLAGGAGCVAAGVSVGGASACAGAELRLGGVSGRA